MQRDEVLSSLITDSRPEVRRMGIQNLVESCDKDLEYHLVKAMEDPDRMVWKMAVTVLKNRQPWLVILPFTVRKPPEMALSSDWGKAYQALRSGIRKWLASRKNKPHIDVLKRWIELPGAVYDVIEELGVLGESELVERLEKMCRFSYPSHSKQRQIIFSPTYECNLTCDYCYAKEWDRFFTGGISLKDLDRFFIWAKSMGIGTILLAGGEPTVYRHLPLLLKRAKKEGLRICLTTNTLYSKNIREMVQPEYIDKLTVHLDQSLLKDTALYHRFTKNLQEARSNGLEVYFRYTLTDRSHPAEWNAVLDIASNFNIPTIDYACAFENFSGNNRSLKYVFNQRGNKFEKLLTAFVKECRLRNFSLHLCKPVPLCAFSKPVLKKFLLDGILRSACGAYLNGYSQNLTVNPDLSTFPCNAIGIRGPGMETFIDFQDAGRHYQPMLKKLLFHPYHKNCNSCVLFFRGLCQGACLAEKYLMLANKT